jgi:hypothetical protein
VASLLTGGILWFSIPSLAQTVRAYWELHDTLDLEAGR